jgi:predicted alpha/beta-fold hydrolase
MTPLDNNNDSHESVLKRLKEVASIEYPFYPIPKLIKPNNKNERVNLKSWKNLRPVYKSIVLLSLNIVCPPLIILFIGLGCYYNQKEDGGRVEGMPTPSFFFSLGAIFFVRTIMKDPFFIHYITNGRFGGLGRSDDNGNNAYNGKASSSAKEGFFCNEKNNTNIRIRNKLQQYIDNYSPTPYLYSGDLLTFAPFLLFKGSIGGKVLYQRYWVKVPIAPGPDGDNGPTKKCKVSSSTKDNDKENDNDNEEEEEAVALDIVFPKDGYQSDKPTFLVSHGLNGGSTEPYILDLARRATKEGCTVAVMINRGLMKTPIKGYESFHGARTSDLGCTVDALNYALYGNTTTTTSTTTTTTTTKKKKKSKIIMVGFSMGGIIVANYTAKSKENNGIAGTLCFSGSICADKLLLKNCPSAQHSIKVWQPPLAWGLKASIVKPLMPKFVQRNITMEDVENAHTVIDIDTDLVCKYHGYSSVHEYYEDNSASGLGDTKGINRLMGTKVPLLAVHAIDDPIALYEVTLHNEISNTDNVMLLSTKHGGHIGWPTGWFPSKNRWNFMIDIAMDYASEIIEINSCQEEKEE